MIKRLLFLIVFTLISSNIIAQYEPGYITSLSGEKKAGYIKSEDLKYNPETIYFKPSLNSSSIAYTSQTISEFGIGEKIKYLAKTVQVDVSSNKLSQLGSSKNPILEKKNLFLKKIVDGKISLFQYKTKNGSKFFVKKEKSDFQYLTYIRYYVSRNRISENEFFKQQLTLIFSDDRKISRQEILDLDYSEKSLGKIISKYNNLQTNKSSDYFETVEQNKPDLKLNVFLGTQSTSVNFQNRNAPSLNPSFENLNVYFGSLEGELLFLKNKLSVFSGITLKTGIEESINLSTSSLIRPTQTTNFTYKSSSLSFGIRYYLKILQDTRVVFNVGFTEEWVSDFEIDYEFSEDVQSSGRSAATVFYGIGVSYKRILLEARINLSNRVFDENTPNNYSADSSGYSLMIGYKLF